MTAPISIAYEDWKATVDAANKAQERVKKLEIAHQEIIDTLAYKVVSGGGTFQMIEKAISIARKALEE
jgi:hypothetical protein